MSVSELCREHGMSSASFYKWRAKFGGMDASMVSQMKAMADENRRLKRMVLTRLRSGLPTHLCSPSFKGQGAFSTQ